MRVRLSLTAQYDDAAIYLRQTCTQQSTGRACNDDSTDPQHSLIETTLDAGSYTVFVDGFGNTDSASYSLETQIFAP